MGEEDNEGEVARSKIPDDGCRESDSLFIGVCFGGAVVQGYAFLGFFKGVQRQAFGGAGVWGKKHTVNVIFNHGQLWK